MTNARYQRIMSLVTEKIKAGPSKMELENYRLFPDMLRALHDTNPISLEHWQERRAEEIESMVKSVSTWGNWITQPAFQLQAISRQSPRLGSLHHITGILSDALMFANTELDKK